MVVGNYAETFGLLTISVSDFRCGTLVIKSQSVSREGVSHGVNKDG